MSEDKVNLSWLFDEIGSEFLLDKYNRDNRIAKKISEITNQLISERYDNSRNSYTNLPDDNTAIQYRHVVDEEVKTKGIIRKRVVSRGGIEGRSIGVNITAESLVENKSKVNKIASYFDFSVDIYENKAITLRKKTEGNYADGEYPFDRDATLVSLLQSEATEYQSEIFEPIMRWKSAENRYSDIKTESDKLEFKQIEVPEPDTFDSVEQCEDRYNELETKIKQWNSVEHQHSNTNIESDKLDFKKIEIPEPDTFDSIEYDDIERGELIGSGGFADVYTGKLAIGQTEATVAVKEPRMSGTIEVSQSNQLVEEAKRWSRLDDHDHIVRVIDYGGRPLPWIIMEYMEAGSLDTVADEMSFEEKLQAAVEVTDAVNHAHHKGVAHLDIKPENILFTESGTGRPVAKVADWGLSKHLVDQSKSREGMTVEYAAPEQFDPEQSSDNLTDTYQLGAVFYQLFTGRSPFSGKVFAVMEQIKNEDPDLPSNIADVPKELDEILLTAMSKDPDDRYESIIYLRDRLQKMIRNR